MTGSFRIKKTLFVLGPAWTDVARRRKRWVPLQKYPDPERLVLIEETCVKKTLLPFRKFKIKLLLIVLHENQIGTSRSTEVHIPNRKFVSIIAAMVALLPAQQAGAADLLEPTGVIDALTSQGTDWSGFYAGAIAGWGVSQNDAKTTGNSAVVAEVGNYFPASLPINQRGFTTGLTAGYNWQFNRFVVGIEADATYFGLDAKSSFISPGTDTTVIFSTEASQRMDFFSTVRGRVGVPISESAILFGTAGLAIGRVDYKTTVEYSNDAEIIPVPRAWYGREKGLKLGWAAGAGGEYKFTEKLSVKLEGLYYSLADSKATAVGNDAAQNNVFLSQFTVDRKRKNNGVIARAGLNYRF